MRNRAKWIGAVLVAGTMLAGTEAVSQQQFNGTWSVEVLTNAGDCDRAYRYQVGLQNGQLRYAGSETGFEVSGRVSANGTIQGSITRGQDRADVTGRLAGERGTGTWRTSGGRPCSGTWSAEKRG